MSEELTVAYMLGAADTHDGYRLERTQIPTVRGWYWYTPTHRPVGKRKQYEELFFTSSTPFPIAAYYDPDNKREPVNIDGIGYRLDQLPGWYHGPSKEAQTLAQEGNECSSR